MVQLVKIPIIAGSISLTEMPVDFNILTHDVSVYAIDSRMIAMAILTLHGPMFPASANADVSAATPFVDRMRRLLKISTPAGEISPASVDQLKNRDLRGVDVTSVSVALVQRMSILTCRYLSGRNG